MNVVVRPGPLLSALRVSVVGSWSFWWVACLLYKCRNLSWGLCVLCAVTLSEIVLGVVASRRSNYLSSLQVRWLSRRPGTLPR